MKAITTALYVCGSLMIAATIMGAVHYQSAKENGSMDKLYKEEAPVISSGVAVKEIEPEGYSRKAIDEPIKETITAVPKKEVIKKTVAKVLKPAAKKRKRISFAKFSRAAIVEEIVLPDSTVKQ